MFYTTSHEWIAPESGRLGITKHAVSELGEVVFVELPKVGDRVEAGAEVAVLESTKAAVDIYTPVGGVICAVNEQLQNDPSLLTRDPEAQGWLVQLEIQDTAPFQKLLDEASYSALVKGTDT